MWDRCWQRLTTSILPSSRNLHGAVGLGYKGLLSVGVDYAF